MSTSETSDVLASLSTPELLIAAANWARAEAGEDGDEYWQHVRALHKRPERGVFEQAAVWCRSTDARERCLGATVLAQLGASDEAGVRPFTGESVTILLGLLQDHDEGVVEAAAHALGHQRAGKAARLQRVAGHPSAQVRCAVAMALHEDDAQSLALLLKLMTDVDAGVRDWATFNLRSQRNVDTPDVRDALAARLADDDDEARGEAMVGLAERGDARVIPAIVREFVRDREAVGQLAFDAAETVIENGTDTGEVAGLLARWRRGED